MRMTDTTPATAVARSTARMLRDIGVIATAAAIPLTATIGAIAAIGAGSPWPFVSAVGMGVAMFVYCFVLTAGAMRALEFLP